MAEPCTRLPETADTQAVADIYANADDPDFDHTLAAYAMDADLTLYWPWVRHCWEESR